jgi:hypothetical protein
MASPLALALLQQPPVAAPPQVTVNPTDITQIYRNAQDAALAAWKAKLDQQKALWGNLATLGGAGIRAAGGPLVGKLLTPGNAAPVDY